MQSCHLALADVAADLEGLPESAMRYLEPLRHEDMRLGLYSPRHRDPQQPHDQDELYLIATGTGTFVHGNQRDTFGPGDALFVAAGVEHRFEDFSDDFNAWVVFFGPRKVGSTG